VKAFSIARVNLLRMVRERANVFFVFVFPMLLILVLGVSFGGSFAAKIGVVAVDVGPLGQDLIRTLDRIPDVDVERVSDEGDLLTAVERGQLQAGVVIPAGYDESVRNGDPVGVRYVARRNQNGLQLAETVQAAVAEQGQRLRAAAFAASRGGVGFDQGLATADRIAAVLPVVSVETSTTGTAVFPASLGRFDIGASSQLLLFIFLTSLTGGTALIETRRLGVSRRMLSTPTSTRTIVGGEALGRFGVAMVQGVFIMLGSLLVFGVDWGQPLGAVALLVAFGLVGAGAGMLLGSTLRNEQQAGGIGIFLGLGLAALGGCMVPLEFFSPTMQVVAHITPHAWAIDGYAELVRHGGTVIDVLPELGILLAYGVALLGLAAWRLRLSLTG
jgi:ABC-2 type transport system permease protein